MLNLLSKLFEGEKIMITLTSKNAVSELVKLLEELKIDTNWKDTEYLKVNKNYGFMKFYNKPSLVGLAMSHDERGIGTYKVDMRHPKTKELVSYNANDEIDHDCLEIILEIFKEAGREAIIEPSISKTKNEPQSKNKKIFILDDDLSKENKQELEDLLGCKIDVENNLDRVGCGKLAEYDLVVFDYSNKWQAYKGETATFLREFIEKYPSHKDKHMLCTGVEIEQAFTYRERAMLSGLDFRALSWGNGGKLNALAIAISQKLDIPLKSPKQNPPQEEMSDLNEAKKFWNIAEGDIAKHVSYLEVKSLEADGIGGDFGAVYASEKIFGLIGSKSHKENVEALLGQAGISIDNVSDKDKGNFIHWLVNYGDGAGKPKRFKEELRSIRLRYGLYTENERSNQSAPEPEIIDNPLDIIKGKKKGFSTPPGGGQQLK